VQVMYSRMVYRPEVYQSDRTVKGKKIRKTEMMIQEVGGHYKAKHDGI